MGPTYSQNARDLPAYYDSLDQGRLTLQFGASGITAVLSGTDELGRDMLTRTLHGGRVSLIVGVFAMLVAVTLGTIIGAVAGYFGGVVDNLLMRFTDMVLALPLLPLLMVAGMIFAQAGWNSLWVIPAILGVL